MLFGTKVDELLPNTSMGGEVQEALDSFVDKITFPSVTLYKTTDGLMHLAAACTEGTPCEVPFLQVEAHYGCDTCYPSPAFDEVRGIGNVTKELAIHVSNVEAYIESFEATIYSNTSSLFSVGNVLEMLDDLVRYIRPLAGNLFLESFVLEYITFIRDEQQKIKNYLRSPSGSARVTTDVQNGHLVTPNYSDAVLFHWEYLRSISRATAEAYGIDLGNGIGVVTEPWSVGLLCSRDRPIVLPNAQSLSVKVFEIAAGLFDEDYNSVFSQGEHLLEAAKLLADR